MGALLLCSLPARGQLGPVILNPIPVNPTNVAAGNLLILQITYANIGVTPLDPILFNPLTNAPAGATIQTNSGLFTWQPTTNQVTSAAGTNITVSAYEYLNPANIGFLTFNVVVTNPFVPATAPVLGPIANQTISGGGDLQFSLYATNTDNTTNPITFNLTTDTSADITNAKLISLIKTATATNGVWQGVFYWATTPDDAGLHTMTMTASEASTGAESAARSFTVNVLLNTDCPQYSDFLNAVQLGIPVLLTDCATIVVTNTFIITNDVTIMAETNVVIAGNNLARLFTVLPGKSLTLSNLTLMSGRGGIGGAILVEKDGSATCMGCSFQGNTAAGANGVNGTLGDASDPNYGKSGGPGLYGLAGAGGAIWNQGTLNLLGCQFLTNSAVGGNGGDGGNGAGGSYQGGNGGAGGNGNVGYGGAIYNMGKLLVTTNETTNCVFLGNTAIGGDGGTGGAGGGGVFNGYAGSGGSGAYAAGGAIFSGAWATIEGSLFSGNAAQAGTVPPGAQPVRVRRERRAGGNCVWRRRLPAERLARELGVPDQYGYWRQRR